MDPEFKEIHKSGTPTVEIIDHITSQRSAYKTKNRETNKQNYLWIS